MELQSDDALARPRTAINRTRHAVTVVVAAAAVIAAGVGISAAASPSPRGAISGCVNHKSGVLSVLVGAKSCPAGSAKITWRAQGLRGAVGAAGAAGARGSADTVVGPQGPTGAAGKVGATGDQGATGPTGPPGVPGKTGQRGPAGASGATGATGPVGASAGYEGVTPDAGGSIPVFGTKSEIAKTVEVPAGTYLVSATASFTNGDDHYVHCQIGWGNASIGPNAGDDSDAGDVNQGVVSVTSRDVLTTTGTHSIGYFCTDNEEIGSSDTDVSATAVVTAIPVTYSLSNTG
jgi:Collagen triple helix repeat (20 copies)